jgi:hypothetical protein
VLIGEMSAELAAKGWYRVIVNYVWLLKKVQLELFQVGIFFHRFGSFQEKAKF